MNEPDGQQERFVLPKDPEQGAAEAKSPAAKPKAEQTQTSRPKKRPPGDDPPKVPSESQAVNPVRLTVLKALSPTVTPAQVAKPIAAASSTPGASAHPAQVASQSSAGAAQAVVGQMVALAASPKGAGDALIYPPAQSQSPAAQTAVAMPPAANASAEQAVTQALTSRTQQTSDLSDGVAKPSSPATAATGRVASTPVTAAAAKAAIPADAGLDATAAKVVTVTQSAAAAAPGATGAAMAEAAGQAGSLQMHQAGARSFSDTLQQNVESATGGKSQAGLDSAMPDGAKALAQPKQTQKVRAVSLPGADRPVEMQAADATSVLEGSWGHVREGQGVYVTAQPAGQAGSVAIAKPAEQIIENIRQAVQNGQRDVTINLNPPELGRVRLRMYTEGNEIRGRLEVDNPHSFNEIRQQAELLTQRLMGEGVPIRQLDVRMSPTASQTTDFSTPQHDGAGQGEWGQPGGGNGAADHGPNRQLTETPEAGSARVAAKSNIGDSLSGEGLNVWI